jgi:hypothetical protein
MVSTGEAGAGGPWTSATCVPVDGVDVTDGGVVSVRLEVSTGFLSVQPVRGAAARPSPRTRAAAPDVA